MDSHCVHQSGHVAKAGQFGQKRLPGCPTARLPNCPQCSPVLLEHSRDFQSVQQYMYTRILVAQKGRALPCTQQHTIGSSTQYVQQNLAASKIEADSSGGGWLSNSSRGCGYRCLLLTVLLVVPVCCLRLCRGCYEHQCYQLESFDDLAHKESYSLAGFLQKKRWAWHWPRSNTLVIFAKNHPKTTHKPPIILLSH